MPDQGLHRGDGMYLKHWREWRGLTQQELGETAWPGTKGSKSRVSRYETGSSDPQLSDLRRLAEVLGIRTGLLFWSPRAVMNLPPKPKKSNNGKNNLQQPQG